jgi:hypothetical protein
MSPNAPNPPPDLLAQLAEVIIDHLRRIQESIDALGLIARDLRREIALERRERKAR